MSNLDEAIKIFEEATILNNEATTEKSEPKQDAPKKNSQSESQTLEGTSTQALDDTIQVATLDEYILKAFHGDIETFKTFSEAITGFKNLDDDNFRLYPGLYAVGGVPSAGKTTFCLQLADNIASRGEFCIYFSLEQTKFEVVSKGIARKVAQIYNSHYVTAVQIRNGFQDTYVKNALSQYMNLANHQVVIDKQFSVSVSDIERTIERFISDTGHKPVVFVDYLQALKPELNICNTKDSVDFNVQALKRISNHFNLPVLVVSSFNRTNYLNIADFESFKESGGIEYTADVVIALQLLAMNADVFDTQSKLQTKRKFVRKAKNSTPRKIELLTLKNRFGKSNSRYFFDYYPAHDVFIPYLVSDDEADDEIQREFEAFKPEHENEKKGPKKRTDML